MVFGLIATEGKHLTQLGPQLGLMAIWIVVIVRRSRSAPFAGSSHRTIAF